MGTHNTRTLPYKGFDAFVHNILLYEKGKGRGMFLDGIRFLTDAGVYNSEKPTKKLGID
jgi:hypothetical protein